jgi:DNA-binding transcriptional LysR family regulator
MIAVPIGPRVQRFATAASPAYLDRYGRPQHPRDLLKHACLRGRFTSGVMPPWEFERKGEIVHVDPSGPLLVQIGAATDLTVETALAGDCSGSKAPVDQRSSGIGRQPAQYRPVERRAELPVCRHSMTGQSRHYGARPCRAPVTGTLMDLREAHSPATSLPSRRWRRAGS